MFSFGALPTLETAPVLVTVVIVEVEVTLVVEVPNDPEVE